MDLILDDLFDVIMLVCGFGKTKKAIFTVA